MVKILRIGGRAGAEALSPRKRSAIAKKAMEEDLNFLFLVFWG